MASSFVVGEKFRGRLTELLGSPDSSLPRVLKEELVEILEKPKPTILPFSTARRLKKHLQDKG